MRPKHLIKAILFLNLFFLAGHTVGMLAGDDGSDPAVSAVLRSMMDTRMQMPGATRSIHEVMTGLSVNLSIALAASAVLLVVIHRRIESQPEFAVGALWSLALLFGAFTVTGFVYFFPLPAVTCLLATILVLVTIRRVR